MVVGKIPYELEGRNVWEVIYTVYFKLDFHISKDMRHYKANSEEENDQVIESFIKFSLTHLCCMDQNHGPLGKKTLN